MKIGFNARHLFELHTGVGVYLDSILHALSRIDTDNTYYLYIPNGGSIPKYGNNFYTCRCFTGAKSSFDDCFFESESFLHNRPDILHLQHCHVPKSSSLNDIAISLTIHDIMPYVFLSLSNLLRHPEYIRLLSFRSLQSLWRFPSAMHSARYLFAVSSSTLRDSQKYLVPNCLNLHLAKNGLDPLFRQPASPTKIPSVLKKYSIKSPFIIDFSGLTARKNTKRLVKAWLRIDPALRAQHRLVITGDGQFRHSCQKSLKKIPNHGIHFTGNITRDELHALVSAASLSIYISLYEGFGLPILESLGCHVPVIASNTSSMNEVMKNHVHHVNPFSRKSIQNAIEKFLNKNLDTPRWADVQHDLHDYSWEKSAQIMLDVWVKTDRQT